MNKVILIAGASFLAFVAAGCGSGDVLKGEGCKGNLAPVKLVIESPRNLTLGFQEVTPIQVRVLNLDDTPAADREVSFSLSSPNGGSAMAEATKKSGADGRLSSNLTSGNDLVSFNVVVSEVTAESQSVAVVVDGVYRGELKVRFQYSGLIPLQEVSVRVHEGSLNCAVIDAVHPPSSVASGVVASPASIASFTTLVDGQLYTVTASALGRTGEVAATGCAVAPAIVGRGSVTVTVNLNLFPERFVGTYDFRTKLHTNQAFPGSTGAVIDELGGFFLDPANVIATELVTLLADQLGWTPADVERALAFGWISYATLVADPVLPTDADHDSQVIDDAVQWAILDQMPGWVNNALTVGGDLTELMRNLTVGGDLKILTASSSGAVTGHWSWSDFLFMWRYGLGCDLPDTCCGRHRYSGDQIGLTPISADFTGTLTRRTSTTAIEYDMLVPEHRLSIEYGRLAWFAFENLMLPAITGHNNLPDAIASLFGCDPANPTVCGCARVGAWVDDFTGQPGLGAGVCTLAVTAISEQLEASVVGMRSSGTDTTYFMMGIEAVLSDADLDLRTDKLTGGVSGKLYVEGTTGDFTGDLYGDIQRRACAKDATCTSYEACRAGLDVLDDCEGRLVCMPRVGDRVAGQNCSAASQCKTGVCLGTGVNATCFTTCDQSGDCPNSLACGQNAVTVTVTTAPPVTLQANACGR
ncbi:MAG: hypothetical protein HY903_14975 [Deltaproteobacteria bacterium]|nr:hypothetical protein [Deltaproteobacteria bacterium]